MIVNKYTSKGKPKNDHIIRGLFGFRNPNPTSSTGNKKSDKISVFKMLSA